MRPLVALALLALPAHADAPDVVSARAISGFAGWIVEVTLTHPDTGWNHYADGWRIETDDGTVLGERILTHPHVTEQPFTRSLDRVSLTGDHVLIRTGCSADGWSDDTYRLDLP